MIGNLTGRAAAAAGKLARLLYARARHRGVRFGKRCDIRARFCLRRTGGAAILIGDHCVIDNDMTIECSGELRIGDRTVFGHHDTIAVRHSVEIGEDCLIAEMVSIRDHNHRFDRPDVVYREQGMVVKPVKIGRNVWLGAKVTVAAGVTIGDNTVVGANSVVTRDLPSDVVAVGAPARVIRNLPTAPPSPSRAAIR